MRKRLVQGITAFVVVLVAAQFIRPDDTNRPTDPKRAIAAHAGVTNELVSVLDRSCGDCHSNSTAPSWYTNVAPFSWLMAYGVTEGRKAVNFSDWAGYSPDQQQKLLTESCQAVMSGEMPGPYTVLRPVTRLSSQDVDTICTAAREMQAHAGHAR